MFWVFFNGARTFGTLNWREAIEVDALPRENAPPTKCYGFFDVLLACDSKLLCLPRLLSGEKLWSSAK